MVIVAGRVALSDFYEGCIETTLDEEPLLSPPRVDSVEWSFVCPLSFRKTRLSKRYRLEITKRNHYNPCFWTALWNPIYFDSFLKGTHSKLSARDQMVHALSVKSGNIFYSKVDNIHFDKNLGMAEITYESSLNFCRSYHPEKLEEFRKINKPKDYPVFIDLEDLLTHLERSHTYNTLLETIRNQTVVTPFEKSMLACWIYIQLLRGHAAMSSSLEWNVQIRIEKFEYFVLLKWALSDRNFLFKQIGSIALSHWVFYRTQTDTFPLSDSPVLVNDDSVIVTLSPRLLLEMLNRPGLGEISWDVKDGIDNQKLDEFQKRTIGNTFREIIFSDKQTLEAWKQTEAFENRVETVNNMKSYNTLVLKEKQRELWHLNAFGNQNLHKASQSKKRRTRR